MERPTVPLELPIIDQAAPVAAAAPLAEAEGAQGEFQPLHGGSDPGSGPPDGVRACAVPESHGVLFAEDGDVHDFGRHLHAIVRLLFGRARAGRCRSIPTNLGGSRRPRGGSDLRHVVITSVTRDDLPDGGAGHFARCIQAVRDATRASVEVLTPDFRDQRGGH